MRLFQLFTTAGTFTFRLHQFWLWLSRSTESE
ncbi:Uncharacterised protein [Vibrio cholerae]|nr:Uncharacterised protein [Vibrio cholerae]